MDSDMYLIKEIFGPTIQGEGVYAGQSCIFLRFAVCNLSCTWCDTDFDPVGATPMTAADIVAGIKSLDIYLSGVVVVTGGEPALQWDTALATALSEAGYEVHMESNGTRVLDAPVDWLTVSPKPRFHEGRFSLDPVIRPDAVKVVVDGSVDDDTLRGYQTRYPGCTNLFLQPCDDGDPTRLQSAIKLVERNPDWRLSVQIHKIVGLP
jgi:7-carboxy-7-deazaguanine synthase